jgi:hypothetical protein
MERFVHLVWSADHDVFRSLQGGDQIGAQFKAPRQRPIDLPTRHPKHLVIEDEREGLALFGGRQLEIGVIAKRQRRLIEPTFDLKNQIGRRSLRAVPA